jgi:hypothetical protein
VSAVATLCCVGLWIDAGWCERLCGGRRGKSQPQPRRLGLVCAHNGAFPSIFACVTCHHCPHNRYERELLAYNAAKAAYITAQQAGGTNGAASASGSAKKKKKVEKTEKTENTAAVV